jgi:hypothetical protein
MAPPGPAAALSLLQEELHAINAVRAPPVLPFVVERDGVLAAAAAASGRRGAGRLLGGRTLDGVAAAAEGISHFVYLVTRAVAGRSVSLLELEIQAEVDKFALFLLQGWRPGRRLPVRLFAALRRRLFERVRYHAHLDGEELARYRSANRLAAGYARWLEARFVEPRDRDGLLRELRETYRRGSADKAGYLASRR